VFFAVRDVRLHRGTKSSRKFRKPGISVLFLHTFNKGKGDAKPAKHAVLAQRLYFG